MGLIPTLVAFTAGTLIKAADFNTNYDAIVNAFNNTAVLTDVAKTISVAHTFAADILFSDALYDIGKSGATRPRDGFFSRHLTVGGTLKSSSQIVGDANAQKEIFLQPGDPSGRVVFRSSASVELSAILNSGIWLHGGPASAGSAVAGDIVLANNKTLRASNFAGTDSIALLKLNVGNVIHLAPTAGAVAIGTGVADSGLAAGELGLANNKALRGTNTAGNAMLELIRTQSDSVYIGSNIPGVVMIGTPATNSGATYGDLVVAQNRGLRGVNAAGTVARRLIDLSANLLYLAGDQLSIVGIGSIGTSVSAVEGEVILRNGLSLRGENAGVTNTYALIRLNASDKVEIGTARDVVLVPAAGTGIVYIGTTVSGGMAAGEVALAANKWYRSDDGVAGSKALIRYNTALGPQVGDGTNAIALGAPATVTSAAAGDAVLANAKALRGANPAGTDTKPLVQFNSAGAVQIGDSTVAIGFGAPASYGNAAGGEMVLANAKALRGVNNAGTDTKPLIFLTASDRVAVGSGSDLILITYLANGSLPAAAAAGASGGIAIDSTNHRLVYWDNGVRYFMPIGTSF